MKLEQGQIWRKGSDFIRIIRRERLEVEYKMMKDLESKEGSVHLLSKKEFCRLLKGAELLTQS